MSLTTTCTPTASRPAKTRSAMSPWRTTLRAGLVAAAVTTKLALVAVHVLAAALVCHAHGPSGP